MVIDNLKFDLESIDKECVGVIIGIGVGGIEIMLG